MWTQADARRSRAYTCKLIELAEDGVLSWEQIARDALGWMSEDEVQRFALSNDYVPELYEDEFEEE